MLDYNKLKIFIDKRVDVFHKKRITKIQTLKLLDILKRKNPYLFRSKNILTAEELVRNILSAHLSSQEEGMFGNLLEEIAIFVCSQVYDGIKSGIEGVDLEFTRDNTRYIISVKSGPNWGNSSQIKKLGDNFKRAKQVLRQNAGISKVEVINGCCYGKAYSDNGIFQKICGQGFWELISGDEDLYTKLIEPLGHKAKEKNDNFNQEYSKTINKFSRELLNKFCLITGVIDWEKLLEFNSGKR
ncbi:MAG: cytosolic protein [Caldisericia bacterium]|nr:cytosolic protein [Caldisericia bacterium]